jgi:hypothetical protein
MDWDRGRGTRKRQKGEGIRENGKRTVCCPFSLLRAGLTTLKWSFRVVI